MLAKSLLSPAGFPLGRTLVGGMALSYLAGAGHDCLFLETPQHWGGEQGSYQAQAHSWRPSGKGPTLNTAPK